MKFIKNRPFKARVKVEFPAANGEGIDAQEFTGHFVSLPIDEVEQMDYATNEGQEDYLRRILVGWEGLTDDTDGKDAPMLFSPENHTLLIRDSRVRAAVINAYVEKVHGAKRGN